MKIFVGLILCFAVLLTTSCTDLSKNSEPEQTQESETLNFLIKMYPNKEFKLISEKETELSFYVDGEKINIRQISEHKYLIEAERLNFYLKYNIEKLELSDYILNNDKNTKEKINPTSIEIFDLNMNKMDKFETYVSNKKNYLSVNSSIATGCKSGNVLDCIGAHCEDAGPILCAGCLLYTKCLVALTTWCAIDVYFEIENPLYCERE